MKKDLFLHTKKKKGREKIGSEKCREREREEKRREKENRKKEREGERKRVREEYNECDRSAVSSTTFFLRGITSDKDYESVWIFWKEKFKFFYEKTRPKSNLFDTTNVF